MSSTVSAPTPSGATGEFCSLTADTGLPSDHQPTFPGKASYTSVAFPQRSTFPKAKQANREDGSPYQRNFFDVTTEDDLNQFENKVATYLDQQARRFFWYRARARKDYYVRDGSRAGSTPTSS